MKTLIIILLASSPAFAGIDADKTPQPNIDKTPPALSAPCSKEVYVKGGVCYHVPSNQQLSCLAAHRSTISAACDALLKQNGK